jgi:hypothetical protein
MRNSVRVPVLWGRVLPVIFAAACGSTDMEGHHQRGVRQRAGLEHGGRIRRAPQRGRHGRQHRFVKHDTLSSRQRSAGKRVDGSNCEPDGAEMTKWGPAAPMPSARHH